MAITPETQAQILGFVIISIPIVGALWKAFSVLQGIEDRLERTIREVEKRLIDLDYQSELKTQKLEALNDKLVLAVNGTKELVNHVRSRTQADATKLANRIDQVERYLSKTTTFESRE